MTNHRMIIAFGAIATLLLAVIAFFTFRAYYDDLTPCKKLSWHFWIVDAEHKCIAAAIDRANKRGGVLSVQDQYGPIEGID
ncbi:hypothetical protein K7W03_27540 [Sphingobium sp. PNB]|uniref:hypothetical protein n=1 Tax=Sphingobium sp. PNB TaxID=863934 RepID=UPI001CA3AC22|nr:hypothetical protein [Sphingobium sp. PNB]MCB4863324.1 hypothetical protein [Sphingobium sp. PNB]